MKTNKEVNQILAEFMGMADYIPTNLMEMSPNQRKKYMPFVYDLNEQVKVVKKLGVTSIHFDLKAPSVKVYDDNGLHEYRYYAHQEAIQEATAHALAEVVDELREGSEE